ncbi:NIPSNAP family protein [Paenisporosarcina cavernae]|uniref:NIPSNAP domain-containing protein n=1 Tax=Paenisporosarcina cavernae TaxID=2320858 RepID=A0A385YVH3_9BACL|nr:NIPSNAP family protein [Paenisporosarcina cavernae]AYC29503.1 hypothetical protein D3873_06255 [Paenisporosarcina cavernae]
MIRRRTYQVKEEIVASFHQHFNENLLPAQWKYGATLIGRYQTIPENGVVEIIALWEYEDEHQFHEIEHHLRQDAAHRKRVEDWYEKHGGRKHVASYFLQKEDSYLYSTLTPENEELRQRKVIESK